MIHENEYFNTEFVTLINENCNKVNELLGRTAVVMTNSDSECESGIDVFVDGKHIYQPAVDIEAEAYLEGMLRALEPQKKCSEVIESSTENKLVVTDYKNGMVMIVEHCPSSWALTEIENFLYAENKLDLSPNNTNYVFAKNIAIIKKDFKEYNT